MRVAALQLIALHYLYVKKELFRTVIAASFSPQKSQLSPGFPFVSKNARAVVKTDRSEEWHLKMENFLH